MISRLRRVHPLYYFALLLLVLALAATSLAVTPSTQGVTGSVFTEGPTGASAFRRYVEAMGGTTTIVQGDSFALDAEAVDVLFVIAPSEAITQFDVAEIRRFVTEGGTAVLASDAGILDRALLDAFDIRLTTVLSPGEYPVGNAFFADPPVRTISVGNGFALALGPGRVPLTVDTARPLVGLAREGQGSFVVVGSVTPFLTGSIGDAHNGRFALALAAPAIVSGRPIAFDEYHHGFHPSNDVLVLLTRTWPGRALFFVGIAAFVYLVASGRRLGAPLPLDARPPRSSLEYIRGFAGLVRRSGHGEIARQRLRRELHTALARERGLDPATPFERTAADLAASDPDRAARALAADEALARPLPDEALLRTVREIGRLVGTEREGR